MKNLLTKIFILVGIFAFSSLDAQISTSIEESTKSNLTQDSNKLYFLIKESFPLNANGQIFLDEKWTDGIITDFQDNRFRIPLRYRIANEEMQVQHNNKTKALQAPQIKKIELGERVFTASYYMLNEEKFISFFEMIDNGKIKLLVQYESKNKKGIYSIQKTYYSKKGKAPAEKISSKKKCIMELMQDQKGAIQQYIKKDKINLKKSDDLIKLFEYYNSL